MYVNYQIKSLYHPERSFRIIGNKSLKDRAAAKGLIYGAFPQANAWEFSQNPQFNSSIIQECHLLVAGFYWSQTRPSPSMFNFSNTDYFAKFADANKMLLRGHPLVWHEVLPSWFKEKVSRDNAEQILTDHIQSLVRRYAGRMHSWDVVNEAVNAEDGRSDGLRNTPWLEFLGADYIDLAFRVASASDPHALLVYNSDGLLYDTPEDEANRIAVLKLLEHLKSKGTPIDALGIQSHLRGDETRFNPQKMSSFLRDVASLGLKILVTEIDVIDQKLPSDIIVRDRIVAATYEDYLSVVLDQPAVIAVISWGLSDLYTWLAEFAPRPEDAPVRPLLLDRLMQRKLAWNAVARSFDRSPNR